MTFGACCDRRTLLLLACGLCTLAPPRARAREAPPAAARWPARAIRIIVAYPPGGVSDLIARALAEQLHRQLAVPVLVENRPGAGGTVALESLLRNPADGHALAFAAATAVALLAASRHRTGSAAPTVVPVAGVMHTPVLVVGTPALVGNDFEAMLQAAHARPGGIRWATTGEGTTGHAVLERVRRKSGAAIVHVPYKGGGQQLNDALGGHFEVLSTNVAPLQLRAVRTGRLKALAVGATQRLRTLPDTPTLAEVGFAEANVDSLFGLFAPPGTAPELVLRLNIEVARALRTETLRGTLLDADNTPFDGTATAFAEQVARETRR